MNNMRDVNDRIEFVNHSEVFLDGLLYGKNKLNIYDE
jgi:hypothetical protein